MHPIDYLEIRIQPDPNGRATAVYQGHLRASTPAQRGRAMAMLAHVSAEATNQVSADLARRLGPGAVEEFERAYDEGILDQNIRVRAVTRDDPTPATNPQGGA